MARAALPALLLGLATVAGSLESRAAAPEAEPAAYQPADLVVANRTITTLRAPAYGRSPAERVRAIEMTVTALLERGGPLEVTTAPIPEGVAILVDGSLLLRILADDVDPERGETPAAAAAAAAANLQRSLLELREASDSRALVPALVHSLVASLIALVALWLTWKAYRWLLPRVRSILQRRIASSMPRWSGHVVGPAAVERALLLPLRLAFWAILLLIPYEWLAYVLQRFPYTRPWGEKLFGNLAAAIGHVAAGVAGALPGLFFVVVIFYLTRLATRVVRAFFRGVEEGRIQLAWVDQTTARPTAQLISAVAWLFGLVAAYPYIPGSDSQAFKGIGVFVGLMLSIGSSGIVNQAVSGLMLMYTRALRPGEFVQIGETEGTVRSVGWVNTRIETLRHEEISIPNAVIAATVTRNLSRLAEVGGVFVPTKVTIGYDAPWRQVRAMLLAAAERTAGVAKEPAPRVLQSALQDFYVEYTMLIAVADPARRPAVLDELHGHIQDVFNEHDVQIMSPHYVADPALPKVVPPDQWIRPPATG